MLKYQQLKDSKNNKTESRISKCKYVDIYDNKEKPGLDRYEGKIKHKNIKYILFLKKS